MKRDWAGTTASALSAEHLDTLLKETIAYVRIPLFLDPDWCLKISQRFFSARLYQEVDDGIPSLHMGHTMKSLCLAGDFSPAARASEELRKIYAGGTDPIERVEKDISRTAGWKPLSPLAPGTPYFKDVITVLKAGSALPPHYHDIPPQDVFLFRPKRILACNIYLLTSPEGGSLAVYRKLGNLPEENRFRDESDRFTSKVVEDAPKAEISPARGDMILFAADRFHEVFPPSSPRMVSHCMIGLEPERREFSLWA